MRAGNIFESRSFKEVPGSIKELLKLLEEECVTIILESGEEEKVEVEAVVGNLLVATTNKDDFKFVDIDCICAVIVDCEDILENILRGGRRRKHSKKDNCNDNC